MNKSILKIIAIIVLAAAVAFVMFQTGSLVKQAVKKSDSVASSGPAGMEAPGSQGGMGQPGGAPQSAADITWKGAVTIDTSETETDQTFSSRTADQNALLVTGDIKVEIKDSKAEKTGNSAGSDTSSFYGINSGIVAKDKAVLTLDNVEVTTDAVGANGVFSFGGTATTQNSAGDGTTINISNSTIKTTQDQSGGLMTTGGGIMNASNLQVETEGNSAAAIRSDRGGGTVKIDGGTYKTTGRGSPAIYSTADITVSNADLISDASEGIIIEGKNSVSIDHCTVTDNNHVLNGQSTTYKNIFLYQSMSGDANEGLAEFDADSCTIVTNKGDSFFITNTSGTINLTNNTITNNDSEGAFLRAAKDSWGNTGSNGGKVNMNLSNQKASGSIVVDQISSLNLTLKDGSELETQINTENSGGKIELTLDASSKLTLTGDCYVDSLKDADETYSNIDLNGFTLYVNGTALSK